MVCRFLANGRSFRDLGRSFKMSHCTVSKIVGEITQILWDEFSIVHMAPPTVEDFKHIAEQFYNLWNFPHCIGALDGKHIRIKNPPYSGGMFFNYKHYFSIVLQGLVDANYRFITIDVGNYGKQSDGGTFRYSSLYKCLSTGRLQLPPEQIVPEKDMKLPFVIIADDAYPLLPYLIKPFNGNNISEKQHNYNKRLSRTRRVVEHAFGIITSKWRILKTDIECNVDLAAVIVKAICLLHNLIIDREGLTHILSTVTPFQKKKTISKCSGRPSDEAKEVRERFSSYCDRHRIKWHNNGVEFGASSSDEMESDIDDPDTAE